MTGPLPGPRRALDDADGLMRLAAFRKDHPEVVIRQAEFGAGWEATVPLPRDRLGYFAPRPLGDLLDALEEELDGAEPDPPDSG